MSADSHVLCRSCQKEILDELEKDGCITVHTEDGYSTNYWEEVDLPITMLWTREDYSFHWEEKHLFINYRSSCRECGTTWEFTIKLPFGGPTNDTKEKTLE